MTRAALVLLLLLAASPAPAQDEPIFVSGVVMCPNGRGDGPWGRYSPLPGVQVQVKGPLVTTLTSDENGMFRVMNLLPGEYVLTLRAEGFRSVTKTLDLHEGPPRGMLNFVLTPTDPEAWRERPSR